MLEPETANYMFYDVHRQLDKYEYEELMEFEDFLKFSQNVLSFKGVLRSYRIFKNIAQDKLPLLYERNKKLIEKVEKYIAETDET